MNRQLPNVQAGFRKGKGLSKPEGFPGGSDGKESACTVTDFIFLGSKITADGDCSHEIKRCLVLGRKTMTYLDSILKNSDITLLTKVHTVKAMAFPVVM